MFLVCPLLSTVYKWVHGRTACYVAEGGAVWKRIAHVKNMRALYHIYRIREGTTMFNTWVRSAQWKRSWPARHASSTDPPKQVVRLTCRIQLAMLTEARKNKHCVKSADTRRRLLCSIPGSDQRTIQKLTCQAHLYTLYVIYYILYNICYIIYIRYYILYVICYIGTLYYILYTVYYLLYTI